MTLQTVEKQFQKADTLLENVIISIPEASRIVILGKIVGEEIYDPLDNTSRRELLYVSSLVSNTLSLYSQVIDVISRVKKCYQMASRYPWHGTRVNKSAHLDFVWRSYTNECYIYFERMKVLSNQLNQLNKAFGNDEIPVAQLLKQIRSGLNEYISHRGKHVHEWNTPHSSYYTFELVEKLSSLDSKYENDLSGHYEDAKFEMKREILTGLKTMVSLLEKNNINLGEKIIVYVAAHYSMLKKHGLENSILNARDNYFST